VVKTNFGGIGMMSKKRAEKRNRKTPTAPWVRASISFPPDLYERLEEIAKGKKVSIAWVVRDAAESYLVKAAKQSRGGQL
jgi:hypothetical protein